MLMKSKPAEAKILQKQAQADVDARWRMYEYLAARQPNHNGNGQATGEKATAPTEPVTNN
ncbi:MAG: hypothetical protein ACRC2J_01975, partial [Microcoleaceae cyanobacterium]